MTDAERINQIADELMAYQPVIDIPFERFNDIAFAIVTLGYVSKEEVENLKENRNGWRNRAWNDEKENAELQKQVDELKEQRDVFKKLFENCNNSSITVDEIINTMNSFYREQAEHLAGLKIEQAVKDMAKEILERIMNIIKKSDGFLAQEVVRIMAKQRGVEVE